MHTYVRSENNIYSHPQMKKLRQKHIGINSTVGSQIQSVMIFDVGTSQWTQSVRTSDTKIELSVCTMAMLTHISFNMHWQLVLI